MPEIIKPVICPNCGASSTNHQNCEYCGSLLVRFADANIDIKNTSYGDDSLTLPGLTEHLRNNIASQRNTNDLVVTDIFVRDDAYAGGKAALASVINTNKLVSQDDMFFFPEKVGAGLAVGLSFNPYVDGTLDPDYNARQEMYHQRFKSLASFPLFKSHLSIGEDVYGNRQRNYEYVIDFGEDAEGAARLLSEVAVKVYGCDPHTPLEYHTNVGEAQIDQSREAVTGVPQQGGNKSNIGTIIWIILAIIGAIVYFIL